MSNIIRLKKSGFFIVFFLLLSTIDVRATSNYTKSDNVIVNQATNQDRPFIGEIRLFAGNFDPFPGSWAQCDGRMLDKNTYTSLFSLIGTRYGGNGAPNFQLPKLTSPIVGMRYVICVANGYYPKPGPNIPDPPPPPPPPPPTHTYITRVALGEIRLFSGNYLPFSGMFKECSGQVLKISDYNSLYTLIGNRFGGDGVTTFALPMIQTPVQGSKYLIAVYGFYPQKN